MKRFLSLFIALILVFSMFAVTSVAFAAPEDDSDQTESTASHEVTFLANGESGDATGTFKEIFNQQKATIEMSKSFKINGSVKFNGKDVECWYTDYEVLHAIFPGINYVEVKDEDILGEDDEGYEDVQTFKLTYKYDFTGVEVKTEDDKEYEFPKEPNAKDYQATKVIKLDKAPNIPGYVFAGWSLEFDNDSAVDYAELKDQENRFRSGFEFNMPESDVTVTAHWVAEEEKEDVELYANDLIYVLYTNSDAREDMKDWDRSLVTSSFSVTTSGWWMFRFAVADGIRYADNNNTLDWEKHILTTTFQNVQDLIDGEEELDDETFKSNNYTFVAYAEDTKAPEVSLSESLKDRQTSGLTVGTTYTISTSLDIEDASGYNVYYKVYKGVRDSNEADWTLIYDSKTKEITEDYEKNISSSGVITPLEEDVKNNYVYKIEYTVVDNCGFKGVNVEDKELNTVSMYLSVKMPVKTPGKISAIDAWKIVLYVIAGLSAVGIVVLLCIKPKQAEAADGRYNSSAKEASDGGSDGDGEQE